MGTSRRIRAARLAVRWRRTWAAYTFNGLVTKVAVAAVVIPVIIAGVATDTTSTFNYSHTAPTASASGR